MVSIDTLKALRERVLAAKGPSYAIDRDITRAFRAADPDNSAFDTIRDLTASIDAALALVERVMPECVWTVMTDFGGLCRARIHQHDITAQTTWQDDGATPPLAILAALLSALIAKEEM